MTSGCQNQSCQSQFKTEMSHSSAQVLGITNLNLVSPEVERAPRLPTITLHHLSRAFRPQSPKRKPPTVLERFDPRLNLQDRITNRCQAVAPVRRREEFRFHNARPVGQREGFHRLAGDLVMRALFDDEGAGRDGLANVFTEPIHRTVQTQATSSKSSSTWLPRRWCCCRGNDACDHWTKVWRFSCTASIVCLPHAAVLQQTRWNCFASQRLSPTLVVIQACNPSP